MEFEKAVLENLSGVRKVFEKMENKFAQTPEKVTGTSDKKSWDSVEISQRKNKLPEMSVRRIYIHEWEMPMKSKQAKETMKLIAQVPEPVKTSLQKEGNQTPMKAVQKNGFIMEVGTVT
uniref:Uncharacterized protein n=1 Tax=Sphaerodactylus townsendi TaxID=933632 RepID=A0ACB8F0U3_9SAUR